MPHASRHKLTPADGGGDRKRLISSGSKIACELSFAGFLFLTFGSACRIAESQPRWSLGRLASLAAGSPMVRLSCVLDPVGRCSAFCCEHLGFPQRRGHFSGL